MKDTGSESLKVAVCSGKGGTGKTTFALSLAWTLGKAEEFKLPVRVLDCDVEEPNCHLFIRADYESPVLVLAEKPEFDMQLCIGCGRCAKKCRYNAIAVVKGKPMVFDDMCHSCGVCGSICPHDAINLVHKPIGELLIDKNHRPFSFAFGRLNVGESQSPMIVSELMKQALKDGVNIIDGPPGTACNTVKTIGAADKVILVTEPTPFGAHDLALALDLCAELGKPCGIVINRSEDGNSLIEEIADRYHVPIIGRVPFNRDYARACSEGLILAAEFASLRPEIINSFSRLLSESAVPDKIARSEAVGQKISVRRNSGGGSDYVEMTILSGKGGTGKTTVAGAFVSLSDSRVCADCDVDAANLRLILKDRLIESEKVCLGSLAEIDQRKCIKCGKCYDACRFDGILKDSPAGAYAVNDLNCEGCGFCIEICPARAIGETPAETGVLKLSESERGLLAHASLTAAAENSGKLVTMVRDLAFALVEREKKDWLLVDGPPGTACPAIASITGTDRVILVTEPTVAAIHDLERIIKLVRHFGVTPEIIINKADINGMMTHRIKDMAKAGGYKVLGEIPFDETVKEAIKAGVPIVEFNNGAASEALRNIWKIIKESRK